MRHIINTFIDDFCEELDVDREALESKSRGRVLVEKRMLLSYFLRVKIKLTYEEVGFLLNKKHCTIVYMKDTLIYINMKIKISILNY